MGVMILSIALVAYITIRTVAYGIYCMRETGIEGAVSVFLLAGAAIAAGYIAIYGHRILIY